MAADPPPAPGQALLDATMRKVTVRLMPFLVLMYMMAFLDRTNVGVAKQALKTDAGVSDAAFALGAGIFFVGYALFELPSNLVLHRVGARRWLGRIMISWGVVAAATLFVTGGTSFAVVRLLLGLAEAGFFPGVVLYLTYWFPPEHRGRALAIFYFGYPLALTLGTPFSGLLLALDGMLGLRGWQWMFLLEGVLAALVGVAALFVLRDGPAAVSWLDPDDKRRLLAVLEREKREKHAEGGGSLLRALRDPWLLLFLLIYFSIQIGSYGVVFFLPDQVSALLGERIGVRVALVSSLPWLCAVVFTAVWPPLAARLNRPRLFLLVTLLMTSGGIAVSANAAPLPAVAALCVAGAGIVSSQALFWVFPTDRFGGTAAAGGLAIINSLGNLGGFVAPNLRAAVDAAFHDRAAGLYAVALGGVIALLAAFLLPARGRRVAATALSAERSR
ncbi:MAG: MFS transporter [Gluconacetobacter diazotrophicus]|nr:MFS transporter [Gluconacetobacter diazotrophicus]